MADPIDPRFHARMNETAAALDMIFNGPKPRLTSTVGFVLLTFEFGKTEGGRVNYISNGDRPDMIAAMKEWLARAEGRVTADAPGVQ